ncbi:MAG: M48 family metalloprotease [Synergistaceae bacterium]|nr:M48 family metalloprotease [Synergistaceae bacterium]
MSLLVAFTPGAAYAAPLSVSNDVSVSYDVTPEEEKLARRGVDEVEKAMPVIIDPVLQARVETIVKRLKPQMKRNLPYEVKIVDHKMVNAFALAGGPMYVTTGMLDFVKTDLELAGVLAHEMSHADRKHVITQMARNDRMTLLAIAAMIASRGKGAAIIAANAIQVAVMGAYSIDIEKEADAYGIQALHRAGYNPTGVLTLQERLQEESLKRAQVDLGIYQTHPDTKERIASAIKYMEEHDLPVNRKYPLGLLRTRVEVLSGDLCLTIDETPVWRGEENEATAELFEDTASALWDSLQLETAPYDIRVGNSPSGQALFVDGKKIAGANELPDGTESLDILRQGVLDALNKAKRRHPLADFFR